jgi:hypothetical protein
LPGSIYFILKYEGDLAAAIKGHCFSSVLRHALVQCYGML